MAREQRTKRLNVMLRQQEWEDLQYMATVKGLFASEVVRLLLGREIDRMKRKGEWEYNPKRETKNMKRIYATKEEDGAWYAIDCRTGERISPALDTAETAAEWLHRMVGGRLDGEKEPTNGSRTATSQQGQSIQTIQGS